MIYQGKGKKFGKDGKLYSNKKQECADIDCNNDVLIPSWGLDPRSRQRFCRRCLNYRSGLHANHPIRWKCRNKECDFIFNLNEFRTLEIDCVKHKIRK